MGTVLPIMLLHQDEEFLVLKRITYNMKVLSVLIPGVFLIPTLRFTQKEQPYNTTQAEVVVEETNGMQLLEEVIRIMLQ